MKTRIVGRVLLVVALAFAAASKILPAAGAGGVVPSPNGGAAATRASVRSPRPASQSLPNRTIADAEPVPTTAAPSSSANPAGPVQRQTSSPVSPPLQTPTTAPAAPATNPLAPAPSPLAPATSPFAPAPNATSAIPSGSNPSPAAALSPSPARAHLHRPGTDVDADSFTGSLESNVFVLKGNVTLHSDPKIDREIGSTSESDEPLTVTADEIDVDRLGLTYVAKGHVHFVQGTRSGRADVAMLDEAKHTLDLVGNADVLDGDHRAAAEKMHYDTAGRQFLGAGDVRIYEPLPTPDPNATATPPPKHRRRFPI